MRAARHARDRRGRMGPPRGRRLQPQERRPHGRRAADVGADAAAGRLDGLVHPCPQGLRPGPRPQAAGGRTRGGGSDRRSPRRSGAEEDDAGAGARPRRRGGRPRPRQARAGAGGVGERRRDRRPRRRGCAGDRGLAAGADRRAPRPRTRPCAPVGGAARRRRTSSPPPSPPSPTLSPRGKPVRAGERSAPGGGETPGPERAHPPHPTLSPPGRGFDGAPERRSGPRSSCSRA